MKLSLRTKASLLIGVVTTVIIAVAGAINLVHAGEDRERLLAGQLRHIVAIEAATIAKPIWDLDTEGIDSVLGTLSQDANFLNASVTDPTGKPIAERVATAADGSGTLDYTAPIVFPNNGHDERLGTLAVHYSRATLDAAARRLMLESGAALIVLIVAIAVAVNLTFIMISRPLNSITLAITRISRGELDGAIPATARRDEIGEIARALLIFRANAVQIAAHADERRATEERHAAERRDAMMGLATRLEAAVGAVAAGMDTAAAGLADISRNLVAAADETNQQSDAATAGSAEAAANVQSVAAASEELAASTGEIARQVGLSSQSAEQARVAARRVTETVASLVEATRTIGGVVGLINAIAERTNLLALNATIEAARAGQAGLGFAIVAGEVKQLAGQTAQATERIDGQIQAMRTASSRAVADIADINQVIADIAGIASGIAAAVEEQAAASREISGNIQSVARGAIGIGESIASAGAAAHRTRAEADGLLASATSLAESAAGLTRALGQFTGELRAAA